jgi:hypothetical protein
VYIAATDLLPRLIRVKTVFELLQRFLLFSIGCVALGLTTLHHVHCDVE